MMLELSGLCVAALDLPNCPERAGTHTVEIRCDVEGGDMKYAREFLEAILSGRDPHPKPDTKVLKLFQIQEVNTRENSRYSRLMNKCYDALPRPPMPEDVSAKVRYMFTTPNGSRQFGYVCAHTLIVEVRRSSIVDLPELICVIILSGGSKAY